MGSGDSLAGGQIGGVQTDRCPLLVLRLRTSGAMSSLPHMLSWDVQGHLAVEYNAARYKLSTEKEIIL
jgi:hypothetical protein